MLHVQANATGKAEVRRLILKGPPRSHVFLMPGRFASDVKLAIRKVIGKFTNTSYCERDGYVYPKMVNAVKEFTPKHFKQPKFFYGELHDLELENLLGFAWFDLCGNLIRKLARRLKFHLPPMLTKNTVIAFTFCTKYRANNLIRKAVHLCKQLPDDTTVKKIMNCLSTNRNLDTVRDSVAAQILLVQSLFENYSFDLDVIPYKSKSKLRAQTMITMKLTNFTTKPQLPLHIINAFRKLLRITLRENLDTKLSANKENLLERYGHITHKTQFYDDMRGFKRGLTLYCQNQKNPDYARRVIKKLITMRGYNTNLLDLKPK